MLFDSLEVEPSGGSDQLMNSSHSSFRLGTMMVGHLAFGTASTAPHITRPMNKCWRFSKINAWLLMLEHFLVHNS